MVRLVDTMEAKEKEIFFFLSSRMIQCVQNYFYSNLGVNFLFVPKCESIKEVLIGNRLE